MIIYSRNRYDHPCLVTYSIYVVHRYSEIPVEASSKHWVLLQEVSEQICLAEHNRPLKILLSGVVL